MAQSGKHVLMEHSTAYSGKAKCLPRTTRHGGLDERYCQQKVPSRQLGEALPCMPRGEDIAMCQECLDSRTKSHTSN